jgi:hypothetical protein
MRSKVTFPSSLSRPGQEELAAVCGVPDVLGFEGVVIDGDSGRSTAGLGVPVVLETCAEPPRSRGPMLQPPARALVASSAVTMARAVRRCDR